MSGSTEYPPRPLPVLGLSFFLHLRRSKAKIKQQVKHPPKMLITIMTAIKLGSFSPSIGAVELENEKD